MMDTQTAITIGGTLGGAGATITTMWALMRHLILPKLNTVCRRTRALELNQTAMIQCLKRDYPELEAEVARLEAADSGPFG